MRTPEELADAVQRHEREIASLKAEITSIKDGHAKKELEDQLAARIAELEADIKLQDLQEQIEKEHEQERAKAQRKRGLFRWW